MSPRRGPGPCRSGRPGRRASISAHGRNILCRAAAHAQGPGASPPVCAQRRSHLQAPLSWRAANWKGREAAERKADAEKYRRGHGAPTCPGTVFSADAQFDLANLPLGRAASPADCLYSPLSIKNFSTGCSRSFRPFHQPGQRPQRFVNHFQGRFKDSFYAFSIIQYSTFSKSIQ